LGRGKERGFNFYGLEKGARFVDKKGGKTRVRCGKKGPD